MQVELLEEFHCWR